MFKDISNSLLQFDSSLRVENQSIEEKKELAQELVTLLYMMEEGKNRLSYVKHFQKASDEPDPRFGSFTDLDCRLRVVLADPKNEDLRDLIENNYPDLKRIISQKFAGQNAEDSILKHWYLSEKSARSAKYLIGVAAVDKRILGIYKIGGSKAIELEGVWVSFKYDEIEEILKPVSEKEKNKDNYVAEELKQWTGRNPILYLKEYFTNAKGESILSSQTKEGLARQLKIEPKEFDQLGDREIIVVRTVDLN
ncbi:hypothetical protein [Fructobacillus tropaeoli]|uniref:Uncharacterized protein n=1 Tax=Fructobacillus tropaeoli TaxID=709323 RepID=A0A3F3HBE4_9LACO|nr:hypothetical protein [Fructobacillus tropaeoli]GAP03579.1 hypothetical protein FTRO_0011220 [Fructobacillus tropaeoli]